MVHEAIAIMRESTRRVASTCFECEFKREGILTAIYDIIMPSDSLYATRQSLVLYTQYMYSIITDRLDQTALQALVLLPLFLHSTDNHSSLFLPA